jgi:hypothetical protein
LKSKIYTILIITLILLVGLSLPVRTGQAQDNVQPLNDEFVAALVAMAVNHDMMAGKDEIRDLAALHGFVSDYYDNRIALTQDDNISQGLKLQKNLLTAQLEKEIQVKRGLDILNVFLGTYTWGKVDESKYAAAKDARLIVSGYRQGNDVLIPLSIISIN